MSFLGLIPLSHPFVMDAMNNPPPQNLPVAEKNDQRKKARSDKRANRAIERKAFMDAEFYNLRSNAGLPKMNQVEIFKAYKDKDDRVAKALSALQAQVKGMNQSSVARFALNKANVPNLAALKKQLRDQNINLAGISNSVLEDLVALDDWSSIWAASKPLIMKYGIPILQHLWQTYVVPKLGLGGDEGFNSADWAGNTTNPYRYTFQPGLNVGMKGVSSAMDYVGIHDLVSTTSIKSIICPELCKYRYTYTEAQRTALAVPSAEYSIVSNASGQVGVGIMIKNVVTTGASYSQSYLTIYNDATFSVSTGTQTPSATFNAGLLNGSLTNFDAWRHNVTAVNFLPTASLNTAGAFTLGYNNRFGSASNTATNIGITLSQIKTWPYVTSFNNKTSARFTSVYGDATDDSFVNGNAGGYFQSQYMVLLGSGLPASTEVGRLQIQALAEFIPTLGAFPICPVDFPATGPLTEQFESLMYQRWPCVQMLDLPDAKNLVASLPDTPMKYTELFRILEPHMGAIKPREYVSHSAPIAQLELPNSFEFATE